MTAKKTADDEMANRVAARVLRAMAYSRQTFKDKVEEHVGGAWLEFYKATLATKIGKTEWVEHWMTEVRNLLDRNLVSVLRHEIRGFTDRRKALAEILAVMKTKDAGYRRSAEMVVKKDYKLTKLRAAIDDADAAVFWQRVAEAVEIGLA